MERLARLAPDSISQGCGRCRAISCAVMFEAFMIAALALILYLGWQVATTGRYESGLAWAWFGLGLPVLIWLYRSAFKDSGNVFPVFALWAAGWWWVLSRE